MIQLTGFRQLDCDGKGGYHKEFMPLYLPEHSLTELDVDNRLENRIRHAGFPPTVVDYCSALTKFSYGLAASGPS